MFICERYILFNISTSDFIYCHAKNIASRVKVYPMKTEKERRNIIGKP